MFSVVIATKKDLRKSWCDVPLDVALLPAVVGFSPIGREVGFEAFKQLENLQQILDILGKIETYVDRLNTFCDVIDEVADSGIIDIIPAVPGLGGPSLGSPTISVSSDDLRKVAKYFQSVLCNRNGVEIWVKVEANCCRKEKCTAGYDFLVFPRKVTTLVNENGYFGAAVVQLENIE